MRCELRQVWVMCNQCGVDRQIAELKSPIRRWLAVAAPYCFLSNIAHKNVAARTNLRGRRAVGHLLELFSVQAWDYGTYAPGHFDLISASPSARTNIQSDQDTRSS